MSERNSNGHLLNEEVEVHEDGSLEYWRDVVGYEGSYRVSDRGRVKSLPRKRYCGWGKYALLPEKELCLNKRKDGYRYLTLRGGQHRITLVHHVVLEAFVGNCPEGMECRHLDDDPSNNNLYNLVWGTRKENMADRMTNGIAPLGEANHASRITSQDVLKIRELYASGDYSQEELATMFGLTHQTTIHKIVRRKTWRHI